MVPSIGTTMMVPSVGRTMNGTINRKFEYEIISSIVSKIYGLLKGSCICSGRKFLMGY